jgi:hypothetical protein
MLGDAPELGHPRGAQLDERLPGDTVRHPARDERFDQR